MQQMKRLGMILICIIVAFAGWYSIASNYDYAPLSGTYVFDNGTEKCTLHLRSDQTFLEELKRKGAIQTVQGHWRRYGQAHVSFSSEFLVVSGQQLDGSGGSHGQFDKTLGLFPSLTLAPIPDGPKFRRKLLR